MSSIRAWLAGGLMVLAAVSAQALQPTLYTASWNRIHLDSMIPASFGAWRQENVDGLVVQTPEEDALLQQVYSQVLMRVYRGPDGARVMLAVAYTTDQRGNSGHQVHRPEICYPAQGFSLHDRQKGVVNVSGRDIPVVQMVATQGDRIEPLTYWITLDGQPENDAVNLKLDQFKASLLHGLIQDGMIFRVSVIDPDPARAYRVEARFLNDLYAGIDAPSRRAFFGI
jgi:EpsI family protein